MASTGSQSAEENTSSDGCITPISNTNYDSDAKSETNEESHSPAQEEYHRCNKCKYPYSDPRMLNCFHSICLYCAEDSTFAHEGKKYVQCPVRSCKVATWLRNESAARDLGVDFGLRRYLERLKFNLDDGLLCRSCKRGNKAAGRCFVCAMFLCDACVLGHRTLTIYNGHLVHELNDSLEKPGRHMQCQNHPEQWAAVYCHDCRQAFCSSCHFRHQSCKKTALSDSPFSEWLTSVAIDRNQAEKFAQYYNEGITKMKECTRNALDDLVEAKTQVLAAVEQQFQYLEDQIKQMNNQTLSMARYHVDAYHSYGVELDRLLDFMRVQEQWAGPWDNLQTGPFIVERLQAINNAKPDPKKLHFSFEFVSGNLAMIPQLGTIVQTPYQHGQLNLTTPQPIARPTRNDQAPTHTNGYNHYNSHHSRGYNYNQTAKSSTFSQSSSSQFSPNLGALDLQFGHSNSYENFQAPSPRSQRSSPLTSSQPGSANHDTDNVFNFNSLSLTRSEGSNSNSPAQFSSFMPASSQTQPYQTWSNGIDQPGTTSTPPVNDVFSMSNNPMFEAPTPQRGTLLRSYPPIRRTRMQYISKFGEYGNAEGQFTEPSGVTVDGFNRLVVADTNNHRIQIFDVYGKFKSQFGNHPDSKLTYPNRIAVSKTTGKVVITERAPSHRVQTYTLQGQPLDIFGEDILQHPRGVAVDKDDNIIIVECKVMQVTIFSMKGDVLSRFGCSEHLQFPNSVAVNNRQEIFISDNRAHNVKVFTYRGALLRTIGCEGLTNYPIAVSINQLDQVVVADNHNNFNLTVFTQEGELVAGYESKTKHAQCFDLALTDDGVAVLTSKDFKVYCYPYQQDCPYLQTQRRY
ncbi:hypothetical protein V1264_004069 [Littorina saxatilis]|uniref:B box-type domain-containing protein n=2 Tax=Littorina saxatilis TaxID=31220 RepID=A0AAN9B3V6_9CAEN